MKRSITFALLAGALILVGCDFNPTGPFEGFEGGDGATLTGVLQNNGFGLAPAGVSSSRTASPGFSAQNALALGSTDGYTVGVIVDGEEIGEVEIVGGTFTLRGLPEDFSIQFYDENGEPVGEEIEFKSVKPNMEVDIVVALYEDGTVHVVEEKRTGIDNGGEAIEIEGTAREVDASADGVTGSLKVVTNRDTFTVNTAFGETSIRRGNQNVPLDEISSGDRVHVRGFLQDDGEVFAYEIKLQEEEEEEENGNAPACEYLDPSKPQHILVCHKGRTLSIAPEAWPAHWGHGDECGPCK